MPKVDLARLPRQDSPNRVSEILGDLGPFEGRGLTGPFALSGLGAAVEMLQPGSASSHQHWHNKVDEIVVVLDGVLTLVEEDGEIPMTAGQIAVFPAGVANGHYLRNDSPAPARFFVVSSADPTDRCHYVEADLIAEPDGSLRRSDGRIVRTAPDTI